MADSEWQRLNLVLGLENVIIITFLGKELAVGDGVDGATDGRGSRRRKGIRVAEAKAEKESDADQAHVELNGGRNNLQLVSPYLLIKHLDFGFEL